QLFPDTRKVRALTAPLVLRSDAAPGHELFYDSFFTSELLCTDTLAMRVLAAGCTGIGFLDLSHPGDRELRYRTLRGLERVVGRDEITGQEIMEVVGPVE